MRSTSGPTLHLSVVLTLHLQVDWDEAARRFLVHDPDSNTAPLLISASELDHARQAFGTDEDLLVLSWPPQRLLCENGNALRRPAAASPVPPAALFCCSAQAS